MLAVVSAPDVGLLTAAVVLLGRPRPAQQLLAYLIGGMGLSIIFGLLIVLALHGSNLLHFSASTRGVIELVAAALLLSVVVAVLAGRKVQWRPRRTRHAAADRPGKQSLHDRALGNDSVWIAWAAGALYSVPGAYYLAGLALLAKLNKPAITDVFALIGFNLIMFTLIELPLIGFVLAPDRTRTLTGKLHAWMTRHRRVLIASLTGAIGTYLLISGLSDVG